MAKSNAYNMRVLINSRDNWKLIENYLAVEITALVTKLQTCDEKDLKKLQGELAALRKIEALPSQLKNEQKANR
tara:strand:- start:5061 stop:5282 length:222 start_codon:yes stop_codon:yes gene_type:complete